MPDPCSVVIADDHPVFRAGLQQILAAAPEFAVVAEAGDGPAALQAIREQKPAIALLDFDLPGRNGLEIARTVQREQLATRVVILTMHNAEALLNEALDLGVNGYLLKDNAATDIVSALQAVVRGDVDLSPAISAHLARRRRQLAGGSSPSSGLERLTPTERRILRRIAANQTSKEIGRELFISHRTVETHRSNICEKLNLRGSNKLLQFALEHRDEL
jgi:DNA-binding NarL/FixJ family response regulator